MTARDTMDEAEVAAEVERTEKESLKRDVESLVGKYLQDRDTYEVKGYPEAQARTDFISPLFAALGWDIENRKRLKPHLREVVVEQVTSEGRPDYAFRLDGRTKLLVEAKAPSESLDNVSHIMQLKSYAYSSREVSIAILTNFASFKVYDASQRPDERHPETGLILEIRIENYSSEIDRLWTFSKTAVERGLLDGLLPKDPQSKLRRIPVDEAFLEDMTTWRTELAKDLFKRKHDISARHLGEVVQKILDRLVFIRIAEDRSILPPRGLFEIVQGWRAMGERRAIQPLLNRLFGKVNDDLNGEVFKPHDCEKEEFWFDSELLATIIETLYVPKSPYRFDVIGVEVLGSMYERYLGKTIRLTDKRVKVEDKLAALKSHGVYYTPTFVVRHIVAQTVKGTIDGKPPSGVDGIAILDPACGSGSFLVAAFQELIDYHIRWYEEHPEDAKRGTLFPNLIREGETSRVSIERKGEILKNCIYGVDLDPQAVEITMMSLYLKVLEGERGLPENKALLPRLKGNVRVGDSLSPPGVARVHQTKLDADEEGSPYVNWSSFFPEIFSGDNPGFDVVLGNPPYVSFGLGRVGKLEEELKEYYRESFPNSAEFKISIYALFVELAFRLLRQGGRMGYIVPDSFLTGLYFSKLRGFLLQNHLEEVLLFDEDFWTSGSVGLPVILVGSRDNPGGLVRIAQVRAPSLEEVQGARVDPAAWARNPAMRFRLLWKQEDAALCISLERDSGRLGESFEVHQGLNRTHRAAELHDKSKGKAWRKCLADADCVRPFTIEFHGQFLDSRTEAIGGTPEERAGLERPKLIFPRTGDDAYCAVDDVGYYPTNALIFASPVANSGWDLHAVAAIVNSTPLRRYHQATTMKEGRAFPQIEVDAIEGIPLPKLRKAPTTGVGYASVWDLASLRSEFLTSQKSTKDCFEALDKKVGDSPTRNRSLHDLLGLLGRTIHDQIAERVLARKEILEWVRSSDGLGVAVESLSNKTKVLRFDENPLVGTEGGFDELFAVFQENEIEVSGRKRVALFERYRTACETVVKSRALVSSWQRVADAATCLLYGLNRPTVDYVNSISSRYAD